MSKNRDDFTQKIKDTLSKRVNNKCSNPDCRKITAGPSSDINKAINIGVAAHICAAASGGPRYDKEMTAEQRKSIENGIWLCQSCSKLIDSDENLYSTNLLKSWKSFAEEQASRDLKNHLKYQEDKKIYKIERMMKDLLDEMSDDLIKDPLKREFVLLPNKDVCYWGTDTEFVYYADEHLQLQNKVNVLKNNNLIFDITNTNVNRYQFDEDFVDWLIKRSNRKL